MADLDRSRIADLFEYDGADLIRKVQCKKGLPGPCRTTCVAGYYRTQVDGISYKVHRLIWTLVRGPIPAGMFIDHINGIRTDNRIENLRLVSPRENQFNRRKRKGGLSAFKGVTYCAEVRKYRATIQKDYKALSIGFFETELEAALAYNAKAAEMFGEHACLNEVA